jgi:hypothetical protein
MSEELRTNAKRKFKDTMAKKTDEQKEQRAEKYLKTMSEKPKEELETRGKKISAGRANRTEEQKQAEREKRRAKQNIQLTQIAQEQLKRVSQMSQEELCKVIKNGKGRAEYTKKHGTIPNEAMLALFNAAVKLYSEPSQC